MPKITFIHANGAQETVEVEAGNNVMQGAIAHRVRGILAECGGAAMCATCHVYVDEPFAARFPRITDAEDAMLDSTVCERKATSRLSCQLVIGSEHDGLVVTLPAQQI